MGFCLSSLAIGFCFFLGARAAELLVNADQSPQRGGDGAQAVHSLCLPRASSHGGRLHGLQPQLWVCDRSRGYERGRSFTLFLKTYAQHGKAKPEKYAALSKARRGKEQVMILQQHFYFNVHLTAQPRHFSLNVIDYPNLNRNGSTICISLSYLHHAGTVWIKPRTRSRQTF